MSFFLRYVALVAALAFAGTPVFAKGIVETSHFDTTALGVAKSFRIYLPAGYADSARRYPVIYLVHGWGVTERAWTDTDGLAEAADGMDLQAIVVMPDGDRGMWVNGHTVVPYETCLADTAPSRNKREKREEFCVRTPNYEDYVVKDLIAHIDARYRTVARREARAVSGESAGGFGAMSLAFRHPDIFASVASHSGFVVPLYSGPRPYVKGQAKMLSQEELTQSPFLAEHREILGADIANWRDHSPDLLAGKLKSGYLAIYFDCGTEDEFGFLDHARYFRDRLTELGIAHEFQTAPGTHNDALFRQRIKESLRFHAVQFKRSGVYPLN